MSATATALCTRRLSWPPSSSPRFSSLSLSLCGQVSRRFAAVLLRRRASPVLAHLPSPFRLGRSVSGMGWVRAEIDDGVAGARSGVGWSSIRAGEGPCLPACAEVSGGGRCSRSLRWRRPSGTATCSLRWRRPPGTACNSFSLVKVGAQRRNMGAQIKENVMSFADEKNGVLVGPLAYSSWLYQVPWGLYKYVTYIKKHYENPTVFISENGLDNPGNQTLQEALHDTNRIDFYRSYLEQLKKAVDEGATILPGHCWTTSNGDWVTLQGLA